LVASLIALLVVRTGLSIWLSDVNGRIVKAIMKRDLGMFIRRIFVLFLFAFPSCLINSLMEYVTKLMGLSFRKRMTDYFHGRYLQQLYYYKICNLDTRIPNPDQRLTQDIEKWSGSLSSLILNFAKPLLDIVMFSRKLIELIGVQGPLATLGWYLISGIIIRFISPEFGKLTAQEQKHEGDYRNTHSEILNHSEEIAFLRGHEWEKRLLNKKYG
jgi:ATP-binding cassette subfamily D (ALD) protein 3